MQKEITKELNSATEYLRSMIKTGAHKEDCENVLMHLANIDDIINEPVNGVNTEKEALHIDSVMPRFSVSLVYQNVKSIMLRTLILNAKDKANALLETIQYFKEETDGMGLVLKAVIELNEA